MFDENGFEDMNDPGLASLASAPAVTFPEVLSSPTSKITDAPWADKGAYPAGDPAVQASLAVRRQMERNVAAGTFFKNPDGSIKWGTVAMLTVGVGALLYFGSGKK